MNTLLLSQIIPDLDQPRQSFDPVEMERLEKSIKERGVLNPLIVEKTKEKDKFLLLAGERRYRVSKKVGLKQVPVEIVEPMSPTERMSWRFHEQETHSNWTTFDKARAIYFFMQSEHLTPRQIGEMLGVSHFTVVNWVEILKLSKRSQVKAIERRIPFSYLFRIAKIAKKYTDIVDMPLADVEDILLEKVESRAVRSQQDMGRLYTIVNAEGNNEKKIKFLKDKNYTLNNLINQTPAGSSIKVDKIVRQAGLLSGSISRIMTSKVELSLAQEKVLQILVERIEKLI